MARIHYPVVAYRASAADSTAAVAKRSTQIETRVPQESAGHSDLVGALLLTGIDATDRFAACFPLVMLLGLLMLIGLFGLLEEALG